MSQQMEIPRPRSLRQFSSQRSQLSRRSAAAAMFWRAAVGQHSGKTSTEASTMMLHWSDWFHWCQRLIYLDGVHGSSRFRRLTGHGGRLQPAGVGKRV